MSTPFDIKAGVDFAPAGKSFAEPITLPQRKALWAMGLEKAVLLGLDLEQADDKLDAWLADMTKECAGRAIRKLGQWLDDERRRRGIPVGTWRNRR